MIKLFTLLSYHIIIRSKKLLVELAGFAKRVRPLQRDQSKIELRSKEVSIFLYLMRMEKILLPSVRN